MSKEINEVSEEEASEKWARDNAKFVPNDQSEGMLYKSFLAGIEWQKNRELPNTTEQPNNTLNECYFTPSKNSTSATICANCGREKMLHIIGEGVKVTKMEIINHATNPFADKELRKEIEEANFTEEDFKEVSESFEEDDIYDAVRRYRESHPEPPKTIDEDELVERIKSTIRDKKLYNVMGQYDFDQLIVEVSLLAKEYSNNKLNELEKWIDSDNYFDVYILKQKIKQLKS